MPNESMPVSAAMEGEGAYNQHAKLQESGGTMALPLLEKAARTVALDSGDEPVVIADYGSSQGKNSLGPMRVAIKILRTRLGPHRPILVYHIDKPANDFNTLFQVLENDPDRYGLEEPNVFPSAIGRSFYKEVLPPDHVHLGWSSYAAVWLSRIPSLIPGHFSVIGAAADVHAEFERQAAQDWKDFLSLRASELRPGGRLVIVLPALEEDKSGFEDIMNHANAVLAEMANEGAILVEERERMVLGGYPRRKSDLLAPFVEDGQFQRLIVEHCGISVLPDAAWAAYQRDGDKDALATQHALFFRSTFAPSLASALIPVRGADERRAFGDRLEAGLKRRLASNPVPVHTLVGTIVVAKQVSA
jgi:S-adenosylmethionine-dependent carboxyl methyltransferase